MIDYEKLKIATDLAKESGYLVILHLRDNINQLQEFGKYFFQATMYTKYDSYAYEHLDDLIESLQKLSMRNKKETKYKVGDNVYFIDLEGKIGSGLIAEIDFENDEKYYTSYEDHWYKESELYSTKSELIKAQLIYWTEMLQEDLKIKGLCAPSTECEHEYQKTIAKSGMYFINMCHKCMDIKPYCEHESDG